MDTKKTLFAVLGIIVFFIIVSLSGCRGTAHLRADENPIDEKNFRDSMEQMYRHELWANANDGVKDEESDYVELPIYIEDKRTDLCFAIYKDFGFIIVPCGHLNTVNKIILGER